MNLRHQLPDGGASGDTSTGAAASGLAQRLARLEQSIERLRIDAERYFNGALLVPPEDLRLRILDDLRSLQVSPAKDAAEQFRLAGLEARFNSLSELYGRRLRDREEGRAAVAARPLPATSLHDVQSGVVLSGTLESGAVEALWQGLAGGGARLDLDTFRGYLARQIEQIHDRTGSEAVQFRVVKEEGRLKLKAKPLGGGADR